MNTITLSGPAKNAMSTAMMQAVLRGTADAAGAPLLITGDGDAFSAGLDLKEVHAAGPSEMRAFHHLLEEVVSALYHYPGPTAAAVNGHAIAGGAILALVCDHRVSTDSERARIGLNEVALGLQFPPTLLRMIMDCIPRRHHRQVLLGATLQGPSEAQRLGLLDAVSPDPVADATGWLQAVAAHPDGAYAAAKAAIRPRIEATEAEARQLEEVVLPSWTSPAIKSRIGAFFKR